MIPPLRWINFPRKTWVNFDYKSIGFLLLYKRLAPGFRYQWPRTVAEAKQLTREQFAELMKGFNPLQSGLIGEIHPKRIG